MNVNGLILVDAPWSALNNLGLLKGEVYENSVGVKSIRKNGRDYPYVSAQALRYWWRGALQEKYGWNLSPIIQDNKQVFTEADPVTYADDDVFGYMRAQKKETLTRVSPLKVSPLLAAHGTTVKGDFGVMARQDGNPAIHNHEFYSVVLKGIFSLDLRQVGRFSAENRSGFKNISEDKLPSKEEKELLLPTETRVQRALDVVHALQYLSGGAKQTLHHTDVTPKFVILVLLDAGVHILTHVIVEDKQNKLVLQMESLKQVMADYQHDLLSPIFIGRRAGFQDEWDGVLQDFAAEHRDQVHYGSIGEAISGFSPYIQNYYGKE